MVSWRSNAAKSGDGRVWMQFTAMTALVVVVGLSLGMLARLTPVTGDSSEPLELMRVETRDTPGVEEVNEVHRVVPAAQPRRVSRPRPEPVPETPFASTVPALRQTTVVADEVQETVPPVAAAAPEAVVPVDNRPTFNGRPLRKVRTMGMEVTAYSPDEQSCGIWADGITASGYSVWTNGMKLVAADTRKLPFGTLISIPGYNGGEPVPVLDRGGAIKGNRLDVLYPTHEIARRWGRQHLKVTVWEYAD